MLNSILLYSSFQRTLEGLAGFAILGIVLLLILIIVCFWRIYVKAGKPGWGFLIPYYGGYLWFRIAKFSKKTSIILTLVCTVCGILIPYLGIAGIVVGIICLISLFRVAFAFGRTWLFGLLMLIQPYVMFPLLAFDNYEYEFDEEDEDVYED